MDHAYCTILSKSRMYQFLALVGSLHRVTDGNFCLFTLCVHDEAYNLLKKIGWKNIHLFHEKELDNNFHLKNERKMHEYCWTLKPIFLEYIMLQQPWVKRVTYLDSDLFFCEDPGIIFQNQTECSVLLSREEKYNPFWPPSFTCKMIKATGYYNSGFISFKQDEISQACLRWWKEKCIECCQIAPERGNFGDQKYLDEMPSLFDTCDITTPGVNIGPWNYLKYTFHHRNGKIFANQYKLIFFHFSGVRVVRANQIKFLHNSEKNSPFIFEIYKQVLNRVIGFVEKVEPQFNGYVTSDDLERYW